MSPKAASRAGGGSGKKIQGTGEIESLLAALGLSVSGADVQELATYVRMSRDRPSELLRYLPELSRFLSRTIPDSALARQRIARSLEGLEYLVRAAKTVVASDDPDLVRGFQRVLEDTSRDFFGEGEDRSKVDLNEVVRSLMVRTGALFARIPESHDPRVQEAVILLFKAGQALSPVKDLPKVPAADTIEVNLETPKPVRSKRRNQSLK